MAQSLTYHARPRRCWNVLDDARVTQFLNDAVEVLACSHDAVKEPTFQLALAVLALVKDRNEWRNYAERVPPVTSAAND